MASNYVGIEKALLLAVESIDSVTPTSWPSNELNETPDGLWLKVSNVRVESSPVTLGDKGEDNHSGFLQIDINYPKGKGSGAVLDKADEFSAFFTAGKVVAYNNQIAKVLSTSLSQGRYVGGYYRVSLTVNYYARTTRN